MRIGQNIDLVSMLNSLSSGIQEIEKVSIMLTTDNENV